jgi:hypothetical protein
LDNIALCDFSSWSYFKEPRGQKSVLYLSDTYSFVVPPSLLSSNPPGVISLLPFRAATYSHGFSLSENVYLSQNIYSPSSLNNIFMGIEFSVDSSFLSAL